MSEFVVIYGKPFGKQRPRVTQRGGYASAYTPKETVSYETLIRSEYVRQSNKFYESGVPLKLMIRAFFEIPASFGKRKTENALNDVIRPCKKPDWDNIGKIVADALNKVAYADDSQIVNARVIKRYSDRPRVEITLEEEKW